MNEQVPSNALSPWLRFVTYAEQITAPCCHDEGDNHWRVRSQSGGVYRALQLTDALKDFWECEIRARDLDGSPTEPEPASAHEPGTVRLRNLLSRARVRLHVLSGEDGDLADQADAASLANEIGLFLDERPTESSTPPPSVDRFHGVPRDRPIWICSVCNGWNHARDTFCTNTHAGSHPTKGGEQS